MKTSPPLLIGRVRPPATRSPRLFAILGLLALAFSSSPVMAYEWTRKQNGTWNWVDGANWDAVPPLTAANEVYFSNVQFAETINLNTTGDQTFQGGMLIYSSTSAPGLLTFDLQNKSLVFDGGYLSYAAGSTASARVGATFTNGTVQLGTRENAASLRMGIDVMDGSTPNNGNRFTLLFSSGSTFDAYNLANIGVTSDTINATRNYELDLTAASIRSGSNLGVLTVTDSIAVGSSSTASVSDGRNKAGLLKMGAVTEINIGHDLIVGQYIRSAAGNTAKIAVTGELKMLEGASATTLTVGRDLRIGVGDSASGSLTSAPAALHINVGSETEAGGVIYVGYKNTSQRDYDGNTSGSLVGGSESGSLNASVSELRVGENTRGAGGASGLLDLRHSSVDMEIPGAATVGVGTNASGKVYFKEGTVTSQTLTVGSATGTARSILSLGETLWTVEDALLVGTLGEIYITASNLSGIDILDASIDAFSITGDGFIEVRFDQAEGSEPYWALRLNGNHLSRLQTYLEDGLLLASGTYASGATLFYDGQYTYFGMAPIPEPSSILLAGVVGVTFLGLDFRRRKY